MYGALTPRYPDWAPFQTRVSNESFDRVKPTCRHTFSRAPEYSYRDMISGARGFGL